MNINRSGYYKWLNRRLHPSKKMQIRNQAFELVKEYHAKYPSHGYRWITAKIRLDLGVIYSPNYIFRCFYYLGIRAINTHSKRYKKREKSEFYYPNLIKNAWNIKNPMEVVVTDMTGFWCRHTYYELTLYMDAFNNEIVGYSLKSRRGDREGYFDGIKPLLDILKEKTDPRLILHSDHGSVYSSKTYNELIGKFSITHSMSRPGTPTDNPVMEAVNGWMKEELFGDFKLSDCPDVENEVKRYIHYFNHERPSCALGYLTPIEYKLKHANN